MAGPVPAARLRAEGGYCTWCGHDAHALLAETARNDVDDCRAATAWLCVLGAEQPRSEEIGLGAVLDACAETEGCQRWVLGVVDEEPGDVSEVVEEEEPVQETLNSLRRQAIDANRTKAAAPLARLGAAPRWQTRCELAKAAAAVLSFLRDPLHTDMREARKAIDQAVRDARKALGEGTSRRPRRTTLPSERRASPRRRARSPGRRWATTLRSPSCGPPVLDLLAACSRYLGGVVDVDDPQGAKALDVYAPQMSSSLRAALRPGASSIELRSAFRAVHEVGGFLDASAWKRVADVAAKGDSEGVWRQATVAAIVLRDPSLAVDASAWRATCRDGALLLGRRRSRAGVPRDGRERRVLVSVGK